MSLLWVRGRIFLHTAMLEVYALYQRQLIMAAEYSVGPGLFHISCQMVSTVSLASSGLVAEMQMIIRLWNPQRKMVQHAACSSCAHEPCSMVGEGLWLRGSSPV